MEAGAAPCGLGARDTLRLEAGLLLYGADMDESVNPLEAGLERFVRLAPGKLERIEKLEQLRALESGMRIDAQLVDTVPLGVDTPADLERAREMLAPEGN